MMWKGACNNVQVWELKKELGRGLKYASTCDLKVNHYHIICYAKLWEWKNFKKDEWNLSNKW